MAQEKLRHVSDHRHIPFLFPRQKKQHRTMQQQKQSRPRAQPRRPWQASWSHPPLQSTPLRARLPIDIIPDDISSTPPPIQSTTPTPLAAVIRPTGPTTAGGDHPGRRASWRKSWPPSSPRCTSRATTTPRPCLPPSC